MAIFASDAQEMKKKLAALKKSVNEKRMQEGLSTITNDHLLLELITAAFDTATGKGGTGLYICNVFTKISQADKC